MKHRSLSVLEGMSLALCLLLSMFSWAESYTEQTVSSYGSNERSASQQVSYVENEQGLYVAKVELNTPEELKDLFDRAEGYLASSQGYNGSSPIEVVLHGPEVRVFQRKNYHQFKLLVDQAARLDAYNIVDIRVCELWMSADNVQASELPSFVDTVPNGPAYTRQLLDSGYSHF